MPCDVWSNEGNKVHIEAVSLGKLGGNSYRRTTCRTMLVLSACCTANMLRYSTTRATEQEHK